MTPCESGARPQQELAVSSPGLKVAGFSDLSGKTHPELC